MKQSIIPKFIGIVLAIFISVAFFQCIFKEEKKILPEKVEEETYPWPLLQSYVDSLDKNYIVGKFNPAKHKDFVLVEEIYADTDDRVLHRSTMDAFLRMYAAAKQDSIHLKIISATRNFDNQKSIWEAKWNGNRLLEAKIDARSIDDPKERALEILKWSSMPGSSRHHWGTDIDLNALNNGYFESGTGQKEYKWLKENAWQFGFGQPYTAKDSIRPTGYNMEKWHWSYLPLSIPLVRKAADELQDTDITGFDGSETATSIGIVKNYVLGINPKLK